MRKFLYLILVILVAVLAACTPTPTGPTDSTDDQAKSSDQVEVSDGVDVEVEAQINGEESDDTPEEDSGEVDVDAADDGSEIAATVGSYEQYSEATFNSAKDETRVLFFHASWCPYCRSADDEFTSGVDQIPSGVVLFRTNYDEESELKEKYGVTYQHTFVQVDQDGNEVNTWSGGGIDELVSNIQ